MTVNDLIRSSFRLIGELGVGQQFSTDDFTDSLFVLNSMIDAWNIERLTVYTTPVVSFTLTPGQQTYTYGPGGNFNAARPSRIEKANLLYTTDGVTLHLPIRMLSRDEWANVRLQDVDSDIPTMLYADNAFPTINISFLPFPDASCSVEFYVWEALSAFVNQTDTVSVPPGYADAIRYNLAVKLAPEWGRTITPEVAEMARTSKAAIQRLNLPAPIMLCDPAMLNRRLDAPGCPNILTGWY